MDDLDTREWLLTNGLGSFASGTVCDARTRTYHGWLIATLGPLARRVLLLSHLEASLEIADRSFSLGTHIWQDSLDRQGYDRLHHFTLEPVPTWVWKTEDWQVSRRLLMPYQVMELDTENTALNGGDASLPPSSLLMQFGYEGSEAAVLCLRPLIADRDFHQRQSQTSQITFSQVVGNDQVMLQGVRSGQVGTPWYLRWSQGHYYPQKSWYWNFFYPQEADRGLGCLEDLFSPGYLLVRLQPGETVTLEARVGFAKSSLLPLTAQEFDRAVAAEQTRLQQTLPAAHLSLPLLRARDRCIAYQAPTEPRILAGYHWFGDRGRETLLSLPGLAIVPGQFALAKTLLSHLGRLCHQGLIPNVVPYSGDEPVFRSIDCSLWWIEMLGLYLEASQDWDFLVEQYGVVKQIYKAFAAGTLYNIRIDASDGLITWDDGGVALTWMDALIDGQPVTPRHGKPIEINALWYSALCWASQWATRLAENPGAMNVDRLQNQARRYTEQSAQVKSSLQRFWQQKQGYLLDRIEPDDRLDATVRPNAVIALSLHHCAFSPEQGRSVLQVARDRLLTPYGLRTLDPADENYRGRYEGSPHQRDLSAHQGTVWSWLLGAFGRAWQRFYDSHEPVPIPGGTQQQPLQSLLTHFAEQGCLGGVSEMFDGDPPHTPRGAVAHATPIAELLRDALTNQSRSQNNHRNDGSA